MSELHIECPHCGASFDVQIDGELSNMMAFPCANCQTPLMYYHGEISELDRDEFAGLRERLTKVLNVVMRQGSTVNDVADSLKRLVDISNERAEGREQTPAAITDEAIANLEKDLAEMDADSFLNSL